MDRGRLEYICPRCGSKDGIMIRFHEYRNWRRRCNRCGYEGKLEEFKALKIGRKIYRRNQS